MYSMMTSARHAMILPRSAKLGSKQHQMKKGGNQCTLSGGEIHNTFDKIGASSITL